MPTIKETLVKTKRGADPVKDEALIGGLIVAKQYELNPFVNEIYFFPKDNVLIPIVGIDGFVKIANRRADYDGYDFNMSETMVTPQGGKPCPEWMEIVIHVKDRNHAVKVREYLDECYVPPRNGFSGHWQTHTKRALRHKTLIQGFRVAFGITGIYDEDEGKRIISAETIEVEADEPKNTSLPDVSLKSQKKKEAQAEEVNLETNNEPPAESNLDPRRKALLNRLEQERQALNDIDPEAGENLYMTQLGGFGVESPEELSNDQIDIIVSFLRARIKEAQAAE